MIHFLENKHICLKWNVCVTCMEHTSTESNRYIHRYCHSLMSLKVSCRQKADGGESTSGPCLRYYIVLLGPQGLSRPRVGSFGPTIVYLVSGPCWSQDPLCCDGAVRWH